MAQVIDVLEIRKRLGWSRAKLANEAGVNVSTVCRWENEGVPNRGTARFFLERLSRRAPRSIETPAPKTGEAAA